MMSILSKRGLRQCFVLAFLMAILLSSMLLYWKISSSDSMNQTSQDKLSALAKPGLPVSSVSNEVVKEDDGNDDQIAYQKPCVVTASLWRLPATHFQHIPWNRKLSVANHAMELLGQPFDKKLQSFMRRLTNTTVCLKGVVTYMDVFEIVRHRYVPQLALNRTMTLSELMKQADVLKFVKGQEEEYSNDFGVEVSNGTVFHYRHDYKDPCFLRKISLKFDPRCDPDSTLDKKFQRQALIVAVQRSGTHYIWEMLNRLGLDLHHEGVGPNGAVSWLYAVK